MFRSSTVAAVQIEAVPARTTRTTRTHSLRRFGGWLASAMADDGFGDRFAAERRRDEDLVRRVERHRR